MTAKRKIYCVRIEISTYVLAEDADDAASWAEQNISDLRDEVQDVHALLSKLCSNVSTA